MLNLTVYQIITYEIIARCGVSIITQKLPMLLENVTFLWKSLVKIEKPPIKNTTENW